MENQPPRPPTGALHLTRVTVTYADAVRELRITNNYDWHQYVWALFPGYIGERPYLFRIDETDEGYRIHVLSKIRPQRPAWCLPAAFQSKQIPPSFFGHQRYKFNLVANPTKKVGVYPDGTPSETGRRIPLTDENDQVAWLERKAEAGGFAIDPSTISIQSKRKQSFRKNRTSYGTHNAIEFSGVLRVTNPTQFLETASNGIGSAKGFGFGLLMLVPMS